METQVVESLRREDDRALVRVGYGDEDRSLHRQCHAGTYLRLCEGDPEVAIDAHNLARCAHLRAEDRVDSRETLERHDRFFNRDMLEAVVADRRLRKQTVVPDRLQTFAGHNARCYL